MGARGGHMGSQQRGEERRGVGSIEMGEQEQRAGQTRYRIVIGEDK
jgi:hypothetical protein